MKRIYCLTAALLLASWLVIVGAPGGIVQAAYIKADNNALRVASPIDGDAFIAGNDASVAAPVSGELFIFGNTVSVDDSVSRSVLAVGSQVNVNKGSGYNAYLGGNNVNLSGDYAHDVYIAGKTVVLSKDTHIHGDLRVSASNVTLAGIVDGNVYYDAQTLVSSSAVGGNLEGTVTGSITFTDGSVAGDFIYKVPDKSNFVLNGISTVTIVGKSERQNVSASSSSGVGGLFGGTMLGLLFKIVSLLGLAFILLLLAPKLVNGAQDAFKAGWKASFLRGLLFLIVVPLVSLLFLVTLIGWRIALVGLLLYGLVLLVAGAVSLIIAGGYILEKLKVPNKGLWLAILVGVLVVVLLEALPLAIGFTISVVLFFLLFVPTLGAMLGWWHKQMA